MIDHKVSVDRFRISGAASMTTCLRSDSINLTPLGRSEVPLGSARWNRLARDWARSDALALKLANPGLGLLNVPPMGSYEAFDAVISVRSRVPARVEFLDAADCVLSLSFDNGKASRLTRRRLDPLSVDNDAA